MACEAPRLEAQLEYLRSDDRLRERAARAAELTVAERMALVAALGRQAMAMLDRLAPGGRAAPPLDGPVAVAAWLAERLEADGIAYAIGGALALGAHGIPRMTDD